MIDDSLLKVGGIDKMDKIKMFDTSKIVNLLSGNYNEVFTKYFIAAAIPILIIAMLNCFFGHKIFKVFVGIAGIIIGAGAGVGICIGINMFGNQDMPGIGMIAISMIIGALVLGFASFKFYKAGAFCMGLITGVILGIVIMKILNKDEYIIAAVIGGLLMGLLAIDLYKHMVIILTSVNGALIAAACIAIITKNNDPVYILKLGAGLSIAGIIVQYILSLFGKKKNEEEDENEDIIEEKEKKSEKRVTKVKKKKVDKRHAKIEEKKAKKKIEKNVTKKAEERKKDNNSSGLFLVDIISNMAQFIKDKIVNYLNAEDVEDDEDYEDEDYEDEDEDYEDEEMEDEYYEDDEIETDNNVDKVRKQKTTSVNNNIVIKDTDDNFDAIVKVEKALEKTLEENVSVPIFDIDEIGHKLEAQLDNNIEIQSNEELEELIIKQTIRNLEI